MRPEDYGVAGQQAAIALLGAFVAYVFFDVATAKAAFFGGAVAFLASFSQQRRLKKAETYAATDPARAAALIYGSAAYRFAFTLLLFIVGFGFWGLAPLPALIVFALAQFSYAWKLRQSVGERATGERTNEER